MSKIYNKIIHSYILSVIVSISAVFLISILSFMNISKVAGVIGLLLCVVLSVYIFTVRRVKKTELREYLEAVSDDVTGANLISVLPLPTIVLNIDGIIMWYNENFARAFGDNLFDISIDTVISDLKWSDILKSQNGINTNINFNDRHYDVTGNLLRNDENEIYSVVLYFSDRTALDEIEYKYNAEKLDLAIVSIDNYEDMSQKMDENLCQQVRSEITKLVSEWTAESGGLCRRTDRDRFLILFEHQYLQYYIDKKFDVVEKIRAIGENIKQSVSVSIAIGVGGTYVQNAEYASEALNIAHGKGGDQVVVRYKDKTSYYCANTNEYAKSSRVKTKHFAESLTNIISPSNKVILMGHRTPDYDSFGAMMGLQHAIRALGKTPYVILDNTISIQKLLSEAKSMPEYSDLFIDADTGMEIANEDTLVIVVDTNRPSLVSCPELLEKVKNSVLIDHHRRAAEDFISASIAFHETSASSTCEIVAEIMQYMPEGNKMNTFEAKALYVGLLMDTKNFVLNTTHRTFDAASYLRHYGLDTFIIKSLFNLDKIDYSHKVDIVKNHEIHKNNIAISVCTDKFPNVRIVSAQAADEMLSIENVDASFVIYDDNGSIGISGRSYTLPNGRTLTLANGRTFNSINVQSILEKIGGGGHATASGANLSDVDSIDEAKERLISAIDDYLEQNNAE